LYKNQKNLTENKLWEEIFYITFDHEEKKLRFFLDNSHLIMVCMYYLVSCMNLKLILAFHLSRIVGIRKGSKPGVDGEW